MAQLRTASPRWLWHRGLRPCAPGHFGFLHKKPERFHIQLCDSKFRFRTQTIMWLEVLQSRTTHEVFFGLKFRLRTRNILRLKVPQFRFLIQKSVTWSSDMAQCRFRTRKILWLGSYAARFHISPAVSPPHKEYSVTWSSAFSLPRKEYPMSRSSAVLLSHIEQSVTWRSAVSHNILWLEFPQFRFHKKRRHLKFRTSASVWEHYFSSENPLSFNHLPIS